VSNESTTDVFTISGNYDGTLSVQSNNTRVAIVSISGSVVTVNYVSAGSCSIIVSVSGCRQYQDPDSCSVSVSATNTGRTSVYCDRCGYHFFVRTGDCYDTGSRLITHCPSCGRETTVAQWIDF